LTRAESASVAIAATEVCTIVLLVELLSGSLLLCLQVMYMRAVRCGGRRAASANSMPLSVIHMIISLQFNQDFFQKKKGVSKCKHDFYITKKKEKKTRLSGLGYRGVTFLLCIVLFVYTTPTTTTMAQTTLIKTNKAAARMNTLIQREYLKQKGDKSSDSDDLDIGAMYMDFTYPKGHRMYGCGSNPGCMEINNHCKEILRSEDGIHDDGVFRALLDSLHDTQECIAPRVKICWVLANGDQYNHVSVFPSLRLLAADGHTVYHFTEDGTIVDQDGPIYATDLRTPELLRKGRILFVGAPEELVHLHDAAMTRTFLEQEAEEENFTGQVSDDADFAVGYVNRLFRRFQKSVIRLEHEKRQKLKDENEEKQEEQQNQEQYEDEMMQQEEVKAEQAEQVAMEKAWVAQNESTMSVNTALEAPQLPFVDIYDSATRANVRLQRITGHLRCGTNV
jgi:hypothetical protein